MASSILCACQEKQNEKEVAKKIDYYNLPTFSKNNALQAVVEIPAGTNHKIEYHPEEKKFEVDSTDGKPRIINFLPYFGNYGFVPSTFSDPKKGGDGDALDIFVLSETEPSGSVLEVIPIALVRLIDEGESDYKLLPFLMISLSGLFRLKISMNFRLIILKLEK
ncbi:inorganic diphosphatase [Mesonia maritima]|uniref:inorganic diphosphatase n=1 Tax=Mesonia maritima TaxID=1793873 RepID=UPI00362EDAC9